MANSPSASGIQPKPIPSISENLNKNIDSIVTQLNSLTYVYNIYTFGIICILPLVEILRRLWLISSPKEGQVKESEIDGRLRYLFRLSCTIDSRIKTYFLKFEQCICYIFRYLNPGENMYFFKLYMSQVGEVWLIFWWHKHDAAPINKLHSLQGGYTHVHQDPIQHRHWYVLQQ